MKKQPQSRIEKTVHQSSEYESVQSKLILPSRREFVISAYGADVRAIEESLHDVMMAAESQPISRFVFASEGYYQDLGQMFRREEGCLLRLKDDAGASGGTASIQATAISGAPLFPLRQDGRNIGVVYEDEAARYCRICGLVPLDLTLPREKQLTAVLEMLNWILITNDFHFTDTVRTWFYLDHLLDWYTEFNEIRTAFFKERGVFEKMVPASTGIGAANPWGAALTCDLLAIQPKTSAVEIESISSPLQDSALKYASSFSRAVEIRLPSHHSLLISGTASIDACGRSQYEGDPQRQIERTLEVVTALLESRRMTWGNVNRGIAYFTDMADRAKFTSLCQAQGIPAFPLAMSHADVCRHDLLFELEVDAVKLL